MTDYDVVLTIGSNLSDAVDRVERASDWLRSRLTGFHVSETYTTRPISGEGNDYANAVAVGRTSRSVEQINEDFKRY